PPHHHSPSLPTRRSSDLYLRSTKDRSDVSIDAQRRELGELAKRKGIEIVAEYSDAVESAKDEHRPDFQRLLTDMRRPDRPWTILDRKSTRLNSSHVKISY